MKKAYILKAVFLLLFATAQLYSKAQNLVESPTKKDSVKDTIAVSQPRPKNVFLEVGGPGLALTANYDTRFGNRRDKWGYRVGMGYFNTGANSVFSIPLQVNYLYDLKIGGSSDHFLEGGAGTTFVYSKGSTNGSYFEFDNVTGLIGTLTLGYRYQRQEGGLNLRVEFTPIIYDEGLLAAGGISVGWTF